MTATGLKERLDAYHSHPERLGRPSEKPAKAQADAAGLVRYAALNGRSRGQEGGHVVH